MLAEHDRGAALGEQAVERAPIGGQWRRYDLAVSTLIPRAREPLRSEPDEVGVSAPLRCALTGDGSEVQDPGIHLDRPGDRPGPGEHSLGACGARPGCVQGGARRRWDDAQLELVAIRR